jgi:phosphatidate cytidylyltransferase
MNKISVIQRLRVFFIGLPGAAALIILLPQHNHLALNIAVIVFSSLGAVEFSRMLKTKGFPVYTAEAAILGSLSPLAATLIVSFDTNSHITQALFVIGASWLLVSEVFLYRSRGTAGRANPDFSQVLNRLAGGFSVMIYPGLLLSWVISMSTLSYSTIVILSFVLTVTANDSLAWVTGMLFGKNNKGIFTVSPNKSIAGYAGGMAASIGVCIAFSHFFPHAFVPDHFARLPSAILLGFASGITVILGDLAESAIKRSSGFKDSGRFVPGRGGVLDSTDSIALTAPLFYVLYRFLF